MTIQHTNDWKMENYFYIFFYLLLFVLAKLLLLSQPLIRGNYECSQAEWCVVCVVSPEVLWLWNVDLQYILFGGMSSMCPFHSLLLYDWDNSLTTSIFSCMPPVFITFFLPFPRLPGFFLLYSLFPQALLVFSSTTKALDICPKFYCIYELLIPNIPPWLHQFLVSWIFCTYAPSHRKKRLLFFGANQLGHLVYFCCSN